MKESTVVCENLRDLLLRLRDTYGTGSAMTCMLCTKERRLVLLS